MKRIILWSLIAFFFGAIALSPAVFIYLYNQQPPVSYSRRQVLTPVVAPGDELKIRISSDVSKRCNATVYRTIIDSTGRPFDFEPQPRSMTTDYTIKVVVPLGAYPGPANYSARILWSCNPVQEWFPQEVIQRNIDFEIAPADGQMPMPGKQGVYEAPVNKTEYAVKP